jgi:drug/metabolite transporter (DMT)-like permease
MNQEKNFTLGVLLTLLGSFLYACYSAGIKLIGENGATSSEMIFFTYLIGWIYLLPFAFKKGLNHLKTERIGMHLLRGIFGVVFVFALIYSLQFIPLVDAVMLNNTAPLFMPLIVYFWLGVPQDRKIWYCIVPGIVGIAFILKPDQGLFSIGAIVALLSGIFMAFSWASIRKLTMTEPAYRVNFYYFFFATLISAVPYLTNFSPLSWIMLFELLGCGVLFLITALLITFASAHISMVLIPLMNEKSA